MSKDTNGQRSWLKNIRNIKSQYEVALMCGITQQHYSRIERGICSPSVTVAKTIAEAMGFDWKLFYDDDSNSSHA